MRTTSVEVVQNAHRVSEVDTTVVVAVTSIEARRVELPRTRKEQEADRSSGIGDVHRHAHAFVREVAITTVEGLLANDVDEAVLQSRSDSDVLDRDQVLDQHFVSTVRAVHEHQLDSSTAEHVVVSSREFDATNALESIQRGDGRTVKRRQSVNEHGDGDFAAIAVDIHRRVVRIDRDELGADRFKDGPADVEHVASREAAVVLDGHRETLNVIELRVTRAVILGALHKEADLVGPALSDADIDRLAVFVQLAGAASEQLLTVRDRPGRPIR